MDIGHLTLDIGSKFYISIYIYYCGNKKKILQLNFWGFLKVKFGDILLIFLIGHGHWTLDIGLWTLDIGHWTMDIGPWTLIGYWALYIGQWILDIVKTQCIDTGVTF